LPVAAPPEVRKHDRQVVDIDPAIAVGVAGEHGKTLLDARAPFGFTGGEIFLVGLRCRGDCVEYSRDLLPEGRLK
jgi:hypothetical protein